MRPEIFLRRRRSLPFCACPRGGYTTRPDGIASHTFGSAVTCAIDVRHFTSGCSRSSARLHRQGSRPAESAARSDAVAEGVVRSVGVVVGGDHVAAARRPPRAVSPAGSASIGRRRPTMIVSASSPRITGYCMYRRPGLAERPDSRRSEKSPGNERLLVPPAGPRIGTEVPNRYYFSLLSSIPGECRGDVDPDRWRAMLRPNLA